MASVLVYDKHYNTEHWDYHASLGKMFCKPGDIRDGRWLVLSEEDGDYSYHLVDLEIVIAYEHDGIVYDVCETKNGKFKIMKRGEPK